MMELEQELKHLVETNMMILIGTPFDCCKQLNIILNNITKNIKSVSRAFPANRVGFVNLEPMETKE